MVKIAFHDNCLCERGTTVAVYDYAYYNKHYLKNESIIMFQGNDKRNVPEVLKKFEKEFTLRPYNNWSEADQILKEEGCDIIYLQKAGDWDGKMAKVCKNIIHCVFNTSYKHGDVYGRISNSFGSSNYPFVPYMVNLPNIDSNLRNELNIPKDAVVFGRHGGNTQFNIKYVYNAIDKITDENQNIYFLFLNTDIFCKLKPNIIHLEKIIDLERKTEFINTCDAMIHARAMGETFGSAVAEFSIRNKPVITCFSGDKAHNNILKEKCFVYKDENTLYDIFKDIYSNIDNVRLKDWNAYNEYNPQNIMDKFNELFIKPCLPKVDSNSFINHNNEYILKEALQKEINIHKERTNSAIEKNGGMWDNLYKPGHLHGNWLDNNIQINSCVDIGSGTGWFVNYLKDKYNFKTIYGIEPSESAIQIAKTIYKDNTDINYLTGYAEECLKKINLNEPTLFTTFIVLSHIEDSSVIQILKEINRVAPVGSVFIFNENYDDTFHSNMWHCRTREWWESNLPDWDIQYDERPRPDLQAYKQGLMGKKVK